MWTREQYLWWIRQIRADSSISLSPKNKSLRKIKGVTVSASSPSWKLHFLGANCFLAGYYLFTSEIYQRYFWFATARFLVLSLSLSLTLSPLPMRPRDCFHTSSNCVAPTIVIFSSPYGGGEGNRIFVFSFGRRWLAVRARKYSTRFGCKRSISIEHSCQKVSTKIYSGVGRLRESCLFVLFACQWIFSSLEGFYALALDLAAWTNSFIQSENHDRRRKSKRLSMDEDHILKEWSKSLSIKNARQ